MRPTLLAVAALSFAAVHGCVCRTETIYVCDSGAVDGGADAAIDAAIDAAGPDALPIDAPLTDAAPPDAAACGGANDTAIHVEPTPGALWPQLTADSFGAAATYATGATTTLVRVGADGLRRAPDVALAVADVHALGFDGTDYVIAGPAGQSLELRRVTMAGGLGAATTIGTGRAALGGLAVHASGDVAVLWRADDGSVRVTVVPAVGAPVTTVLHTPPTFVNAQLVGGVMATTSATSKFLVAYAVVQGISATTVAVRPIAPDGAAQIVSTGASTVRERVSIGPGAGGNTGIVTWRDQSTSDPWVTVVDAVGTVGVAPRQVFTRASGDFVTRIAGRGLPGGGFEVLVDIARGLTDRAVARYGFDAAGAPTTTARVATVCTGTNEENLPFTRNAGVRYASWHNGTTSVLVTF